MKMNSLVGLAHNWHTKPWARAGGGTLLPGSVPGALKRWFYMSVKG
jgi:hypothetical protein